MKCRGTPEGIFRGIFLSFLLNGDGFVIQKTNKAVKFASKVILTRCYSEERLDYEFFGQVFVL